MRSGIRHASRGALSSVGAILAAIALGSVPSTVHAQATTTATQDLSCLGTRAGKDLGCSAGDLTATAVLSAASGTPLFCQAGQSFTFNASVTFNKQAGNTRYDIGFFTGQSGNSPDLFDGTKQCSVAAFPFQNPFTNEETSITADTCGDVKGSLTNAVQTVQNIKVSCLAATATDSSLSVPFALSWQQNDTFTCTGNGNVYTDTGPKCSKGAATVTVASTNLQVGGSIDVIKQTLPDADSQAFSYTATGPAGSMVGYRLLDSTGAPTGAVITNNNQTVTFNLNDATTANGAGVRVFMNVVAANRTLTITEQASGQPAHWQNDAAISCSVVTGSGSFITATNSTRQIVAQLNTTNSAGKCTVTNTKRAKITLRESVAGRLDANEAFSLALSGTGTSTVTTTSDAPVAANLLTVTTPTTGTGVFTNGTYPSFYATPGQVLRLTGSKSPGTLTDTYTTSLTCTNAFAGSSTVLPSSYSAQAFYDLTPGPGDDITCTFTNTPKARLTLVKTVVNNQGGSATASAWTLRATPTPSGTTPISGTTGAPAVTNAIVMPGTYALTEDGGPVGYDLSLACSGAADADPSDGLAIASGEKVTCTYTNDDQPVAQSITKTWALDVDADNSTTVTVGDTLRYTVTVTNTGSVTLTNVQISDSKTTPASQTCASVAPLGTCVLSGAYVVVLADQTAGSVSNTASITSTQIPGPVSSPTTNTPVAAPTAAALAVTKSHTGNFSAGANATYTLQVANTGGTAVSGTTTVTDTLAAGLTFVSATGTGWSCGAAGQVVTCTSSNGVAAYGSMPSITLTVTVGAGTGTSVDNTASIANPGIGGGTPVAGNTDTATIVHPDLSTSTKTVVNLGGGATADVDAGDVLEYTITLVESAGAQATNVHVTDTVQSGLGSATVLTLPAGATDNTNGGTVDVPGIPVPANGTVQLKFRVTVGGGFTAGDTIDNSANVDNPAGPDATPGAPTLIYEQSNVVSSGNKILYLHDNLALNRTPPAAVSTVGVTINSSSQQDWVLSPVIPTGQSLLISAGTIDVSLRLSTSAAVVLQAFLYDGATLVGNSTAQAFDEPTPVTRPFPITLGANYNLAAGHALTLRLVNTATGNKAVTIYEYNGGGSNVSFATTTVVHVDSVLAYSAAYSATTTATYYTHGSTVYVRAVGSDPFGGADVGSAEVTITDANGAAVVSAASMPVVATAAATRTFEYALALPANAPLGVWTASVTAHEGTEGTVSHTAAGTFEVRGKVQLGQTWGAGAVTGDTLDLQITGGSDAVAGSSTAPAAATPATAVATASVPITLVQSFTVGTAGSYTVGLTCTRDADGAAIAITGSGLSRQIQMPLDSSVTCVWTDAATVPLTVVKLAVVRSDPINDLVNPRAIPGAIVEYQIIVTNPSANSIDSDSVSVSDPLPGQADLRVVDFAGAGSGPVQFSDGTPSSGLTYTFISLTSDADDLEFEDQFGDWGYHPTPDSEGVDTNVKGMRVKPKGAFNGNNAQFTLKFRVKIQ